MRELAERVYFYCCLGAGRLLRSGRYSTARIVHEDGALRVRKSRRFYAPLLVWIGGLVVRILDTGMRVLAQRAWEERERLIYETVYGNSIRIDADETLVLPCLPGDTLAALLEDPEHDELVRRKAIEMAVIALTAFHARGFTHADAMAENVLVDVEAGVARWFDFETVHDSSRPMNWRRADDLRALLATCLLRTAPEKLEPTIELIVDAYADEAVTHALTASFASVWQRPLTFHLGQAALSLPSFREIARLLRARTS